MYAPEAKPTLRFSWAIGLALLSLVVPLAAVFLRQEPAVPFAHPDHQSYYRQTVAALVLGLACGAGAFVGSRTLTPAWLRWLSTIVAILGVAVSAFWLWALIGTCGAQVLSGVCTP